MPKLGMERIRRRVVIDAAIAEVGRAGSLDVTVGQIARRAGVSAALVHHYFGSKDAVFLAVLRAILREFGSDARARLARAVGPRARLAAIVEACFDERQCDPDLVGTWLAFYLSAQASPDTRRLLAIYRRRLHANLVHELARLVDRPRAERIAVGLAALIDGLYIRLAPAGDAPEPAEIRAIVLDHLDRALGFGPAPVPTAALAG